MQGPAWPPARRGIRWACHSRSGSTSSFALPPDAFTAARDALVKELRTAGDRDGATRVKGLRKPTVAAWALNQLARRHQSGLRRLRQAGEELARAQRRVVSGLDPAALRSAQQRRWQMTAEGRLSQPPQAPSGFEGLSGLTPVPTPVPSETGEPEPEENLARRQDEVVDAEAALP